MLKTDQGLNVGPLCPSHLKIIKRQSSQGYIAFDTALIETILEITEIYLKRTFQRYMEL